MDLIQLSSQLLLIAFILYVVSSCCFVFAVTGQKSAKRDAQDHRRRWGWIGFSVAAVGFLTQLGYWVTRWIGGGHVPTSNLFEFITFFSMAITLAFLVLYLIYRLPVFGIFAMPVSMVMIAYASVFPQEVTPLIPSLQSHWLKIHVTTAALGEGILAVGFAAGLMYLIRTVDAEKRLSYKWWLETLYILLLLGFFGTVASMFLESFFLIAVAALIITMLLYALLRFYLLEESLSEFMKPIRWLEFTLCVVLMLVGYTIAATSFQAAGVETVFEAPNEKGDVVEMVYTMPSLIGPHEGTLLKSGYIPPLLQAPAWMKGVDAAEKLNALTVSILIGVLLYGLLRLIARKPLSVAMQPLVKEIDKEMIDEISYRAVAIGYPIFTLGALIFAMIWASKAWSRFWGWDPKEVWALITWLFYTLYLHLRLSRGWQGERSAWMVVMGFVIILFNLVFVNLVIAGLHSYAGV